MTDSTDPLAKIEAQLQNREASQGLPPVEKWNPALSGDMDLLIKRDGSWIHEGTPILRKELVHLFSTILKREGDEYFLVTPVEKFRIRVEDAPFLAVAVHPREVDGEPLLEFETLVGDKVVADGEHPIRVDVDNVSGEPSPYILVRCNLEALIARSVFYQLVDMAQTEQGADGEQLVLNSAGSKFVLGKI